VYTRAAVTLADLATRLGCRLEGDGTLEITRVAGLEDAQPGAVTFLANPRYASKLGATRASAVIVDDTVRGAPCAVLRTPHPYLAFAEAVALLMSPPRPAPGISPLAVVDPTAQIGEDTTIGPFVAVGARARIEARTIVHAHTVLGEDARVGRDCVIHAHVSIREGVVIGDRVVVQDGAVIGSDGFGFARRRDGTHQKIPQVGRVVIEDDVEIGAHTAIDRPAVGETRIGGGTKIDNLVQVAHGVRIGRNVLLAAQVGIAGSTTLDDDVMMGGQSGATGHVHLGRGASVLAKSAVTKDVPAGEQVAGVPAGDAEEWRELVVLVRRLPELRRAVAGLDERLAVLEARLRSS
jgi:UDP-3-O-[3-hydroxymyristoyl] glucosamine N-acyltransferase